MSDGQILKGKRKKKLDACPNPLFLQWLTEWKDDASSKGIKSQYNYAKAINALKKYPLCLNSGQECKFLENFGDKTCKMLDQKLAEYVAEYGTTEPVPGYLTINIGRNSKSKNKKKSADSEFGDINFNNLRVPLPPEHVRAGACYGVDSGDDAVDDDDEMGGLCIPLPEPTRQRQNSGGRRGREYIPQYRSGPYAIILTLFTHSQRPGRQGYLSKRDLMKEAQGLADKSFTIPDPGSRYTAWSSMGTLIKKGLVIKDSNPAKYRITDTGCALAASILDAEKNGDFGAQNNSNGDDLRFTIGEAIVPVDMGNMQLNNALGSTSQDMYSRQTIPHYGESSECIVELDTDEVIDIPGSDDFDTNQTSVCGLKFSYISEQGHEVLYKDKAAVAVDVEISVGFLVKCDYEDLLMSGKRYKLDTSRHSVGDQIYAFLHDDDSPERSTIGIPTEIMPAVSNLHKPISDKVSEINTQKYTQGFQNSLHPVASAALNPTNTGSVIIESNRPQTIKDCQPKAKKRSEKASSVRAKIPKILSSNMDSLSVDSEDSQSARGSQVPSLSGDSQSQDSSQNALNPSANIEISKEPQFVLSPGSYEILLCVDNQEVFGGGSAESKKQMIKELEKNKVPHNIRPLNVGDFCWVAREKRAENPRELVLDYIVERKRMDDLAGSIVDGRFKEQKFRLKGCGLRHPIYLVEDYGSCQHFSIGEDALFQAITNTQVIDNFYVKRTGDIKESAAYLTLMTRYIQSLYSTSKTLLAVSRAQLEAAPSLHNTVTQQQIQLLNFQDFNKASVKTRAYTVREMFGKQLCQLQGLTGEKAAAILEKYPTPLSLFKAYNRCISENEKHGLLAAIKFGASQRNVGAALSKAIYFLYNTTPS